MSESHEQAASGGSRRGMKLRPQDLTVFCTQIAMFLRAGISLVEGLGLLSEDLDGGPLSDTVKQLNRYIEDRCPLSEAMEKTGGFPRYMVNMVSIGEYSGNLEEMLYSLSRYYEREQALKQRVKSAITYPVVLLVMMAAIVLLLIVQVLPMFNDILTSMGGEMPPAVAWIMAVSVFLSTWWYIVLIVLAVLIAGGVFFVRSPGGSVVWAKFKASCPGIRGVYSKIAAERFSTAMAFLLKSNVDIDKALDFAKDIMGNAYMTDRIEKAQQLSIGGASFEEAIYKAGIFPKLFTRMLGIGFKTGEMDSTMTRLSELYEQDVDNTLKRLTSIIEPAFVAILSIVVGIILISIMLPLIEVMSSM